MNTSIGSVGRTPRPNPLRKSNLPKKIHFGLLQRDGANANQKSLSIWGFIDATDIESICLKDASFGTDMMSATKSDHHDLALNLGTQFEHQCCLKFKGKVYGLKLTTQVRRCKAHSVLPSAIRTGFATVSTSSLDNEEYDPKQSKLSFGGPGLSTSASASATPTEATPAKSDDSEQANMNDTQCKTDTLLQPSAERASEEKGELNINVIYVKTSCILVHV